MDERTTMPALTIDTTDAILAERIDPALCAARTHLQDLLDGVGDDLPLDLRCQLHQVLADALSGAYRQGLRDARVTLADLLDS